MPTFHFDCLLGGVVILKCEIGVRFGQVDRDTLDVKYNGKPFNISGLMLDYEGDIIPLRDYLVEFSSTKHYEAVENARAVNAVALKQHRKDH